MVNNLYDFLHDIGTEVLFQFKELGYGTIMFFKTVYYFKNIPHKRHEIVKQMYNAGVKSFLVATVVAVFTGMILGFQFGLEMKEFGMENRIGQLIMSVLTREMSPFVSAIVLISSVGSAIAAEIATMHESEEIDALVMMSISPVKFLVMPRLVAMMIVFPLICVYFTFFGLIGAAVISQTKLGVSYNLFYKYAVEGLHFKATYVGLIKSFTFGVVVTIACCTKGLNSEGGALGVGRATRSSVIVSFLLILILGFYITSMFYS
ncbi:MAG: ABC transporter permease [Spirochaetes bacterium]|nr:ABC transporter permease [Spirochaetota bacterium]